MFKAHITGLPIMSENIHINLSECAFGPDELEWLLKEWQKNPKPKTIVEIARIYLTNWIKNEISGDV